MTQYFVVKHDLESFLKKPGLIWRTDLPKRKRPIGFGSVAEGDRWVEFAYIKDEKNRQSCSVITRFCECVKPHWYGRIPHEHGNAHMIEGRPCDGYQPPHPVTVPSISQMLGRNIQPRVAIAGISAHDFEVIREEARERELDASKIPLLNREPLNEQELLSIVIAGRESLGIDRIIEVQVRFPDVLVSIGGKEIYLELEVDSLSFWDHIEKHQLRRIRDGKLKGRLACKLSDKDDNRPVAILCWVDGDRRRGELRKHVLDLQVFELPSLLRSGNRIQWR